MRWARTYVIVNHTWIVAIIQIADTVHIYWVVVVSQYTYTYPLNNFHSLLKLLTHPLCGYCRKFSLDFPDHGSLNSESFDCRLEGEGSVFNCGVFVEYNGLVDATGQGRGRRWRYRAGSAAEEAPYPAEDKRSTSFICDKSHDSIDVSTLSICLREYLNTIKPRRDT